MRFHLNFDTRLSLMLQNNSTIMAISIDEVDATSLKAFLIGQTFRGCRLESVKCETIF